MAAIALSGCESDDSVVWPVLSDDSKLTVDRGAPDALASMHIELGFSVEGGEREVELQDVRLYEVGAESDADAILAELAVAFPDDFEPVIDGNDERRVGLVNTGTSHSDLEYLCGGSYSMHLRLRLVVNPDDYYHGVTVGTGSKTLVDVTCP